MKQNEIKVGKRYRNLRAETLLGSTVIYLGVGEAKGPKSLVIVEGVGAGKFVAPPTTKASKALWANFVSENAAKVAQGLSSLLASQGEKNFKRNVRKIANNLNEHPVIRRTAQRLADKF